MPLAEFHQSTATWRCARRRNSQRGFSRSQVKFTTLTAAGITAIESKTPMARRRRVVPALTPCPSPEYGRGEHLLAPDQRQAPQPSNGISSSQPSVRVWMASVSTTPAARKNPIRNSPTARQK